MTTGKTERKRNQLRDEVVDAAKFWRQEHEEKDAIFCSTSTRRLRKAVDALESFEAEHK